MNYTVISFYTVNTPYAYEVKNLIRSLDALGIPHDIRGIDGKGSWEENAKQKPLFIRDMLNHRNDEALVWLDADSVVLNRPWIFSQITTDVAFYFKTTGPCAQRFGGLELITAAMYFANNEWARDLIDRWIEEEIRPHQPEQSLIEQRALQRVLGAWQKESEGTLTYLPQSYCRIFDAPEDHRVIQQNQASRRFRGQLGHTS
jgi:hypothetical protein